jgi:hypothetical protein
MTSELREQIEATIITFLSDITSRVVGYQLLTEQILSLIQPIIDKAQKYGELLKQTEEVCPICHGEKKTGFESTTGGIYIADCSNCKDGKVQHPERIVVLDKDQIPPNADPNACMMFLSGYGESKQDMLEANFHKVKV